LRQIYLVESGAFYFNKFVVKKILALLGLISLGLGIIGAFLPLLPTTPFVLLSAYLFAKSSDKLHNWLMTHRIFGSLIRDFHEEKAISMHGKVAAISMMWVSNIISIFFIVNDKLWLQILLTIISIGVTINILRYKTKKKTATHTK